MDNYLKNVDEDEKSLFYEDMDKFKDMKFKISAFKSMMGKNKENLREC